MYGDSVTNDSEIIIKKNNIVYFVRIDTLFTNVDYRIGNKEYCNLDNIETLTLDDKGQTVFKPIKYVMRHKTNKRTFRTSITNSWHIDTTEDHSLIGYQNTKLLKTNNIMDRLIEIKPLDIGKQIKTILSPRKIPRYRIKSKN